MDHVDVLIVGAGLSGIGAACHLRQQCPDKTYTILEGRGAIGGTWDLFRYPGIRSDSDMFTLGYVFRPWTDPKSIADGDAIRRYVRDTAREYDVDSHIRFQHKVISAAWSSDTAQWTVQARRTDTGEEVELTCSFLFCCTGYYRYDQGYTPEFEGIDRYAGTVVHPQFWPADLDFAGQRITVIGSGATAVTLIPALAEQATHVTMVQRSPTYMAAMPSTDRIADALRRRLSPERAYRVIRWKNVLFGIAGYQFSRCRPERMKAFLRKNVTAQLPVGYDVHTHFTPRYNPWDQRMCLVPDADLFKAIRAGQASIVTGEIETFTERGVRLRSGVEVESDIVVTATGLSLIAGGGLQLSVDGTPVEIPKTVAYKGMMLSGVPNFALAMGYTNASWTLKCDLTSAYVGRLLNYLDEHGYDSCTPTAPDSDELSPMLGLTSGYVQRSVDLLPKQGPRAPWRVHQNYLKDRRLMRRRPIDDEGVRFGRAKVTTDA
jgi:monooxygenase